MGRGVRSSHRRPYYGIRYLHGPPRRRTHQITSCSFSCSLRWRWKPLRVEPSRRTIPGPAAELKEQELIIRLSTDNRTEIENKQQFEDVIQSINSILLHCLMTSDTLLRRLNRKRGLMSSNESKIT